MRNEDGELQVPNFKSEIPEHLLGSLSPKEKWQYEQISIQGKQNAWLIERSVKADRRQNDTEKKVEQLDARLQVFENLRTRLTHKWSLVIGAIMLIGIPMFLNFTLAFFEQMVGKWFGGKH